MDLAALGIGLPYPLILAAVAAVLELIPFLGPVLGGVPAVMVAAVEGPPWRIVAIVLAFMVIQQLEGMCWRPRSPPTPCGCIPWSCCSPCLRRHRLPACGVLCLSHLSWAALSLPRTR